MLAKIIACQPAEPGTAQLMVRLRGETAVLPDLTFTLCNNEQNYLQPDGSWSPAQHWFTVNGGYSLANGSGFVSALLYLTLCWQTQARSRFRSSWLQEKCAIPPSNWCVMSCSLLKPGARRVITAAAVCWQPRNRLRTSGHRRSARRRI